ncbi:MAG TPA: Asp-tRNA(Asn)/Glu-tRNA(Gln) amidotransferase subunit GatC [Aeromicrobium sp.]|nr:Asp-tRNA(Asn)/Glu-tRNA(Gln) amidotransferase subunit GatC [Aeromicrobium sp.]
MPEPAISRADVAHLAGLARISLSDDELDHLATELPAILDHVQTVQDAVEGRSGDDVPAMSHPLPISNVFRVDEVRPSLSRDDVLAGAPASEQNRFLVPKILEEA